MELGELRQVPERHLEAVPSLVPREDGIVASLRHGEARGRDAPGGSRRRVQMPHLQAQEAALRAAVASWFATPPATSEADMVAQAREYAEALPDWLEQEVEANKAALAAT